MALNNTDEDVGKMEDSQRRIYNHIDSVALGTLKKGMAKNMAPGMVAEMGFLVDTETHKYFRSKVNTELHNTMDIVMSKHEVNMNCGFG
jgi:hypothetical protein